MFEGKLEIGNFRDQLEFITVEGGSITHMKAET